MDIAVIGPAIGETMDRLGVLELPQFNTSIFTTRLSNQFGSAVSVGFPDDQPDMVTAADLLVSQGVMATVRLEANP